MRRARPPRESSARDEVDVEARVVVPGPRASARLAAHEPPARLRLHHAARFLPFHSALRETCEGGHSGMILSMGRTAAEAALGRVVLRDVENGEAVGDEEAAQRGRGSRRPPLEPSARPVAERDEGPSPLLDRGAPHAHAEVPNQPRPTDLAEVEGAEPVATMAQAKVELLNLGVGGRVVEGLQVPHVASDVEGAPRVGP